MERAFVEVARSIAAVATTESIGDAVEVTSHRLAIEERAAGHGGPSPVAMARLRSSQREALEPAPFEGLLVPAIAGRMEASSANVNALLGGALLSLRSGDVPSDAICLAEWRESVRVWTALPVGHVLHREQTIAVAHAWLDYQVRSGMARSDVGIFIGDNDRRFVAVSANAAPMLGRLERWAAGLTT